jgi:hypothetical protein
MIANKVLVFSNQVFRITVVKQHLISPSDNCKTLLRLPLVVDCYFREPKKSIISVSNHLLRIQIQMNRVGSFYHFMVPNFILVNSSALFVTIFSDTPNLEEMNLPAKQADAALAEQPDKMSHCSGAGSSQSVSQLENESGACSIHDTLNTHMHSVPNSNLKHETRKRVAFVAVGNPRVPGAAAETKSSEINKKQRLDMISHASVDSGLYNKLLGRL